MDKVTVQVECHTCDGTGLSIDYPEVIGVAVVCERCQGTGEVPLEYAPFMGRKRRSDVTRVFQTNPGIHLVTALPPVSYGGVSVEDFYAGKGFPRGSENRALTCPDWWYQSANVSKRPGWHECESCITFPSCSRFPTKEGCWARFDAEEAADDSPRDDSPSQDDGPTTTDGAAGCSK